MKIAIKTITTIALLLTVVCCVLLLSMKSSAQVIFGKHRIDAGNHHAFAICADSTVRGWGANNNGRVGDNTTVFARTVVALVKGPGAVDSLKRMTAVAGGAFHSLALKSDSTVWAWGGNSDGALGDNSITQRNTPVQVKGTGGVDSLKQIIEIAAGGYHSLAVKNDGTVWAWGDNSKGQIGDGTGSDRWTPVQVVGQGGSGFLTNIIAIAAGPLSSIALKNDGTVWTWGDNFNGMLGDGTINIRATPVQVVGPGAVGFLTSVKAIDMGSYGHGVALKNDGTVWCWGDRASGKLGDSSATSYTTSPVQVKGPTGGSSTLQNITAIAAGYGHTVALKNDSTVWAWGWNAWGQLGDNTTTERWYPAQVQGPGGVGYLTGITSITAGYAHNLALKKDSIVWGWGENDVGHLGDGIADGSGTFNGKKLVPFQPVGLCKVVPQVLPIELLYFTGYNKGEVNVLEWATSAEINNDYFTLENSKDGVQFTNFNTIKGAGNSTLTLHYSSIDTKPFTVTYYRLKQTDYDGKFTYSNTIVLTLTKGIDLISIYPNPANENINYQIASSENTNVKIQMFDMLSRTMITQIQPVKKGLTELSLDISGLSNGIYYLQATTESGMYHSGKQLMIR